MTLGGTPATALLQAVSMTLGWTGELSGARGGTGVNNGSSTFTMGGNVAFSGAYTFAGTLTGNTAVTVPTSGTLATTSGTVASITGTANQVIASASTGAVTLSLPQSIATTSSPIFSAVQTSSILDTNGKTAFGIFTLANAVNFIGTTNSATGLSPSLSASGTDPNIDFFVITKGTGAFIVDSANTTIPFAINSGTSLQHTTNFSFANTSNTVTVTFPDSSGTVAYTSGASGIVNSGLINQMAWYAAAGTTLSGLATANSGVLVTSAGGVPSISTTLPSGLAMQTPASITLTNGTGLPISGITGLGTGVGTALAVNVGTAGSFVVNGGALGTPSSGTLTNATGLPISGITGLGTGVATALAANVTGSGAIVLANAPTFVTGTVTAPSITFSSTSGIIGTTTNNNAAAGSVGEYVENIVAVTSVSLTSGTITNAATLSLTAGDWDLSGNIGFFGGSTTTPTFLKAWVSTSSSTDPGAPYYANQFPTGTPFATAPYEFTVPTLRVSLAAPATVYLSAQALFAISTCTCGGWVYARRRH
jgi:hypothetical protein